MTFKSIWFVAVLMYVNLCISEIHAEEKPNWVGRITDVTGDVQIVRGKARRKARFLKPVAENESVAIAKKSSIEIAFGNANAFEKRSEPGEWKIGKEGYLIKDGVTSAKIVTKTRLEKGVARLVKAGATQARDGKPIAPAILPMSGSTVHPDEEVTFSWPQSPNAVRYRITVSGQNDFRREDSATNHIKLKGLKDRRYKWSVRAELENGGNRPVVDQRPFSVLGRSQLELYDELESIRQQKDDESLGPLMLAAIGFEHRLKMFERAIECYERLLNLLQEEEQRLEVYAALGELYARAGQVKKADTMWKWAMKLGYQTTESVEE